MSIAAVDATDRERLHRRLRWRNRIVGMLRLLVPLSGGAVLAVLVVQMALDGLGARLGFADIRIDRENLVLETPHFTATGDDGTTYALEAREAKAALAAMDVVDLADATFGMTTRRGDAYEARAAAAALRTTDQLLTVPGVVAISSNIGLSGRVGNVVAHLLSFALSATDGVDLVLADGARIEAEAMHYDGATRLWVFDRVTVTLQSTPGEMP